MGVGGNVSEIWQTDQTVNKNGEDHPGGVELVVTKPILGEI